MDHFPGIAGQVVKYLFPVLMFFLGVLVMWALVKLRKTPQVLTRIGVCAVIVFVGAAGMQGFASLKKPPTQADPAEVPIPAEAVTVRSEDVTVAIRSQGVVRSLDIVQIVPQVMGNVVEIHPNLETGKTIPKGEALFVIDPRTYQATLNQAEAQAAQLQNGIESVKARMRVDTERLETLKRICDLAEAEYVRRKKLFEEDEVGTLSLVEATEQGYNQTKDIMQQMEMALELYPIQLQEMGSGLDSARAMAETARLNLERTRVLAPFDARVKSHQVEVGQYVAPGAPVLVLANDSVLEITVPVDSGDAEQWLRFRGHREAEKAAWFADVEPVPCTIRWVEDRENHVWQGTLDRIEQYSGSMDQATMQGGQNFWTINVAVRIEREDALSDDGELPLVEGMYCSVEIPGKTMKGVYRVPSWAVTFENTVYKVVDSRLKTVLVKVLREEGEYKYVSEGLDAGDRIVVTRLTNPLEGALLNVTEGPVS